MSAIKIQAMVREMDTSKRKYKSLKTPNFAEYRAKVAAENEFLYENFPTVFEMHIEDKLDETFFEMLKLKRKIEKNEMTEDEASKLIGQKLFDRFVGPVVNNIPAEKPMSYAEYYEKFK
jgi:hypothetical protein